MKKKSLVFRYFGSIRKGQTNIFFFLGLSIKFWLAKNEKKRKKDDRDLKQAPLGIPFVLLLTYIHDVGDFCMPDGRRICEAEFILERKRFFYRFVACAFPFFWGQERFTDRSISKRYLKSDIATWVEKSSTSRAIHARDTGFYWSSENVLHERFIASSGVGVWMKTLQLISKQ